MRASVPSQHKLGLPQDRQTGGQSLAGLGDKFEVFGLAPVGLAVKVLGHIRKLSGLHIGFEPVQVLGREKHGHTVDHTDDPTASDCACSSCAVALITHVQVPLRRAGVTWKPRMGGADCRMTAALRFPSPCTGERAKLMGELSVIGVIRSLAQKYPCNG